jgi:tetratricopeptide (TPR) repeat protein
MMAQQLIGRVAEMTARLGNIKHATSVQLDPAIDLALDCNDAGRSDLAVQLLSPLSSTQSDYAKYWQVLALGYRGEQDLAAALNAMQQAAALAATDVRIAMGLAQITQEAGLPSAALFHALYQAFPDHFDLAHAYAGALMHEGQGAQALSVLEQAIAKAPNAVLAQDALVQLRTMLGLNDPWQGYAKAVSAMPQDAMLQLGWIRSLVQAQQWDAAQHQLNRARMTFGASPHWAAFDAMIASETGDADRAEALFQDLGSAADPGVMLQHIRHCLRTAAVPGRLDRAQVLAAQLLAGPNAAEAWPYQGLIWRLLGDDRAGWLDGDPPYAHVIDLGIDAADLAQLADVLRGLHTAQAAILGQSVRGGTQTSLPLFSNINPHIQALRAKILTAVRAYVDALPAFDADHPLLGAPRASITCAGSWSVRLSGASHKDGGHHVAHTHSHGWISSALYIVVPDEANDPVAQSGWLQLGASPPELGLNLASYQYVQPKPGRLVLFPSTLWHGTTPFDIGERLTVAFDIARPAF